jgi:hypothetical protein
MRYRLRTLLIVLAVAPPLLAWSWFHWHWFVVAATWLPLVGFFGLWYWQLRKSQAMHPRTRGDWSV